MEAELSRLKAHQDLAPIQEVASQFGNRGVWNGRGGNFRGGRHQEGSRGAFRGRGNHGGRTYSGGSRLIPGGFDICPGLGTRQEPRASDQEKAKGFVSGGSASEYPPLGKGISAVEVEPQSQQVPESSGAGGVGKMDPQRFKGSEGGGEAHQVFVDREN